MIKKPDYFDDVQKKAAGRWEQLEKDRDLGAPWWQLFKQVQSPRHVLSELLQNADDAEATQVSVEVKDGYFSFTHNGMDFSQDDFASLCRFGYSNKRMLRTIGFRGIGFKSTFSLGDAVGLRTPTLSVVFKKERFTQPIWLDGETVKNRATTIIVKIQDTQRQKELENNIEEWLLSPFSLLFFNHIRQLKLGNHELHWVSKGGGPAAGSEWMQLRGEDKSYLVIRSNSEPFPDEALQEIFDERLLDTGEKIELPPCKVEIVLGAPGELFVVLPTGVKTRLPFAINAPFIQDPARLKIKDPEISFTNRWLLRRVGSLLVDTMTNWLNHEDYAIEERAKAYDLLPGFEEANASLESICETTIEDVIRKGCTSNPFVLTEHGSLDHHGNSVCIPEVFWKIWNEEQILSVISGRFRNRSLLSSAVSVENQNKLLSFKSVLPITKEELQSFVIRNTLPIPVSWAALLELWNLVGQWKYFWMSKNLNIFPVRGRQVLYSATDVVRLGEKRLLQSEEDWEFLARYLLVVDVNWLRYLTEQKRIAEENNRELFEKVATAEQLLSSIGIDKPSNMDVVMAKVAKDFFEQNTPALDESVRIAQIAARLNAKAGAEFKFWTRDGNLRGNNEDVIYDTGDLEDLIPPELHEKAMLHPLYSKQFIACTEEEWKSWIQSGNTWVKTFAPIASQLKHIWGRAKIEKEAQSRGYKEQVGYPYVTNSFRVDDFDFPEKYWNYWKRCAENDISFWTRLTEHLLKNSGNWKQLTNIFAYQIATTGRLQRITDAMPAMWVLKLRDLPCLRDTNNHYRRPIELMCRTPETEPLMGVEPFIHAKLDISEVRELLVSLGVRTTPSGPKQILDRLRALSKVTKPPLSDLMNLYERLDRLFESCSTTDQMEIRKALHDETLIFTEDGAWRTSDAVFILADENDAPGAALIHSQAKHFSLWRNANVKERPTEDLAIAWLKQLPVNEKLSASDTKRVRILLGKYPLRVWNECHRWLNLLTEFVPAENLKHALTMQSLFSYGRLHEWVKTETADFQMLNVEALREYPFSTLPALASQIGRQLEKPAKYGKHIKLDWLELLAKLLMRVRLSDESLAQRVHEQSIRLAKTTIVQVETLSTLPYLNGKPAGLPEHESIAWIEETLYFTALSNAKLAKAISERVADAFGWAEIKEILAYCFDRRESEISAYLEENFSLAEEEPTIAATVEVQQSNVSEEQTAPRSNPAFANQVPLATNEGHAVLPGNSIQDGLEENGVLSDVPVNEGDSLKTPRENPLRVQPTFSPLIERFALAQEFQKNGKQQYVHADGRTLIKSDGIFHWELISPAESLALRFWVKEHCLEAKPLEIPTEIWNRLEQSPQEHVLLLEDRNREPIVYSGVELLEMNQDGRLNLYSATYRIVLDTDK